MPTSIDPGRRDRAGVADIRRHVPGRGGAGEDAAGAVVARLNAATTLAQGEAAARALLDDIGWIDGMLVIRPGNALPRMGRRDPWGSCIILLDTPVARITMTAIDHRALAAQGLPERVTVGGRVAWTRYLKTGGATLWRWRADAVDPQWHGGIAQSLRALSVTLLADDAVVRLDGRRDAMLLCDPASDIVSVTITLHHDAAPFRREYDRASGALVQVATLDDDAASLALPKEPGRRDSPICDPAFFGSSDVTSAWPAIDTGAGCRA